MPELRQDIISGRWVIIATNRAKRPDMMSVTRVSTVAKEKSCPFCEGHEFLTPPELDSIRLDGSKPNEAGWRVRAVPNKYPALGKDGDLISESFYGLSSADGYHEVIIHSPDHQTGLGEQSLEQIDLILRLYRKRYQVMSEDPNIKATLVIVNHGKEAGASLEHSHSQLFAMTIVPSEIKLEYTVFDEHIKANGDCVFCDLISHEQAKAIRIVAENERFIAFCPYASRVPFETWILPKEHLGTFELSGDETIRSCSEILKKVLTDLKEGLNDPPFNYWIHTRPASQGDFHWHIEILPKLSVAAGFEMGTGIMINVVKPEDAADYLTTK